MNKEIIISMAQPYVKNGAITYDEFDKIYSILSKREQYDVTEILYQNNIDLIDGQNDDNIILSDIDDIDDDFEILYDESIFTDEIKTKISSEYLSIEKEIHQSNEILCAQIQSGNRQSAQDLCIKNRGLVDKYVAIYEKRYGHHLDFQDLEQVGFMGLLAAAKRFNFKQEIKFSTYAVYWIKQAISREIMDNGYAIRIPVHMMEKINKIAAADYRLFNEGYNFQERIHKISDEFFCSEEIVIDCLKWRKNYLSYTSLDVPIGEDQETELIEIIPIEEEISIEEIIFSKELCQEIESTLSTLSPKEADILRLRFGLNQDETKTLEQIAKKYNVTRERIRQIELKAIKKLRHPSRIKHLKSYWED